MNTLLLVYDNKSVDQAQLLTETLREQGILFVEKLCIPTMLEGTEIEIIQMLSDFIHGKPSPIVIGISSSGNGVAMFANKIESLVAAPIYDSNSIIEATQISDCTVFDILSSSERITDLVLEVISAKGASYAMG